jgi:LuxR family maltose regulon positive regulatory protein
MFDGIQAELLLRQGNFAGAAQWAALHDDSLPKAPIVDAYVQQLTRPKILIAQGSPRALQEATELLEEMRAFLARIHHVRFLVETLALLALAAQRSGATSRGLAYLEEALSLAQPGGLVRVFVDCGGQLLPLLDKAAQRAVAPALAAQVAAVLRAEQPQPQPSAPAAAVGIAVSAVNAGVNASLVEALTPRELEVLTLLAERLTNKEIALMLGVTSDTVKQHTGSIYGKLQVNGRRQAVMQARTLGLLPQ